MKEIDPDTPLFKLTVSEYIDLHRHLQADKPTPAPSPDPDDDIIDIDEIFRITKKKKSTIYQRSMKGTIPVVRKGRKLYASRKAIHEWLLNNPE